MYWGGACHVSDLPFLATVSSVFNSLISGSITNVVYIPPKMKIAGSTNQKFLTGDVSRKYSVTVDNVCIAPIQI
jgi:hypothetical protein